MRKELIAIMLGGVVLALSGFNGCSTAGQDTGPDLCERALDQCKLDVMTLSTSLDQCRKDCSKDKRKATVCGRAIGR